MTIPKVIHQIWIGPHDPPQHWIEGWKLPGWEHRLWRDEDLDQLQMSGQRIYDHYRRVDRWCGAANVARAEILAVNGGVYIDADTRMVTPLDDAPFMKGQMWAVRVPEAERLNNAALGCAPGHPAMLAYREAIATVKPRWHPLFRNSLEPSAQVTGGWLLTQIAQNFGDIEWVAAGAFTIHHKDGTRLDFNGTVYGDHVWGTTSGWYPPERSENRIRQFAARSQMLKRAYHRARGTTPWDDINLRRRDGCGHSAPGRHQGGR